MKDELNYILARTVAGKQSRRAFLGRAGALGLSAAMANGMLASAVQAAGPVKGGTSVIAFVQDPDGYKIELIERS